jgi:hypothetical protein
MTASAKRSAETDSVHIAGCAIDLEIASHVQRSVVNDMDSVLDDGDFIGTAILAMVGQSPGRTSLDDIDHRIDADGVRNTPGIPVAYEKIVVGATAFANVNAEPPIPAYLGLRAFIGDDLVAAHRLTPVAVTSGILADVAAAADHFRSSAITEHGPLRGEGLLRADKPSRMVAYPCLSPNLRGLLLSLIGGKQLLQLVRRVAGARLQLLNITAKLIVFVQPFAIVRQEGVDNARDLDL